MSNKTPIKELDFLSQLLIRERELIEQEEKIKKEKEIDEHYNNLEEIVIKLPPSLLKFQKRNNKIDNDNIIK
jgi:hypothetical protein